ncbi:MAG: SpoIVB peptidase [Clostridia bacterium]|nr:SpoIVB peptidase [Clostridia bacterium]
MRLVFKMISAFCLCFCLLIIALSVIGYFVLPDSIVTGNGNDNSKNVIYTVQSVSSDGQVRTFDAEKTENEDNAFYSLLGIFPVKKVNVTRSDRVYVYPSGQTFGLKLYSDGVLIVSVDETVSEDGSLSPAKKAGLKTGDIIRKMNSKPVSSSADVTNAIAVSKGKSIEMIIERDGKEIKVSFTPVRSDGGVLKAGMWIRDSFAGIGTMTFYTDENVFGGLGHAVTDIDTGQTVPISGGEAVKADINGCIRGTRQAAGELYGSFTEEKLGDLFENGDRGVFGLLSQTPSDNEKIPVALRQEISTGKAQIKATVDENGPEYFDINIIKLNLSSDGNLRNMVIEVTDERLIEKTGGIVQGMSGSPIIQNNKLVGAVTHVFVNNPLQGYGIFAENMINEAEEFNEKLKTAA